MAAMSGIAEGDCSRDDPGRAGFLNCCGVNKKALASARQVHGRKIVSVEAGGGVGEADGLITNTPGVALGITVADCVPVLLFDPRAGACGAVHAGRAGTELNIAGAAVSALATAYGSNPPDIVACVGPSAGPCCYEVSEEMAAAFAGLGLPVQGRNLDLWGANRMQLEAAGVPANQISISGTCTICGTGFHSYRSGDKGARNMALILL